MVVEQNHTIPVEQTNVTQNFPLTQNFGKYLLGIAEKSSKKTTANTAMVKWLCLLYVSLQKTKLT